MKIVENASPDPAGFLKKLLNLEIVNVSPTGTASATVEGVRYIVHLRRQ